MSRRLILCIDGTNNYPNGGYTNIQRLFRMFQRDAEQLTYYQPGVGTIEPGSVTTRWGRRLLMGVDGASAWLLKQHVLAAYRYLMSEYQQGDQIYLYGFSRGAFTVRVLAGMLSKVGILHPGFDSMLPFAWETYRRPDNRLAAAQFRLHYARFVKSISFLGLFDTVSAVGLPWVPRVYPRTASNFRVARVRHALALDEHRAIFVQNRWRPADHPGRQHSDVQQVWFAGVHSDIGGGYPDAEAGLSLIPLAWMQRESALAGVLFKPKVSASLLHAHGLEQKDWVDFVSEQQRTAPIHDELPKHWYWRLAEYLPIPRRRSDDADRWRTEWVINRGGGRNPGPQALVHRSVRLRQNYRTRAALDDPQFVD